MPAAAYATFASPWGPLLAEINAEGVLTALRFDSPLPEGQPSQPEACPGLAAALDAYITRRPPTGPLALAPVGTPFQVRVWTTLREIPFGHTWSYARLAERVGSNPRAVGQANGQNPIAILVPCHRVIGSGGALVGYAGGLPRKRALLVHEGALLC